MRKIFQLKKERKKLLQEQKELHSKRTNPEQMLPQTNPNKVVLLNHTHAN
jgi:hypothetical protein